MATSKGKRKKKGMADPVPTVDPPSTVTAPAANRPVAPSIDDLRRSMKDGQPTWIVRKDLAGGSPAPKHLLGGDAASFVKAAQVPATDWDQVAAQLPGDAELLKRRLDLGLVAQHLAPVAKALVATRLAPASSGRGAAAKRPRGDAPAKKSRGGRK